MNLCIIRECISTVFAIISCILLDVGLLLPAVQSYSVISGSSIKVHNVSSVIVNGQLQPRIVAILGYAALDTITAEHERDEEAEESKKEKIRNYRHRRGQLYCFFCE
jgi:hypothetical protein